MAAKKLYYLAVERYESRWTHYVSGPDGMFADGVRDYGGIELESVQPHNDVLKIQQGHVVDTEARTKWSFWQVEQLIKRINAGEITSESVLYFEDFWHPGMEMIPYTCQLKGIRPRVYAFCHAQSVDINDFSYAMLPWIRHFEKGWASWLTGIFVAAQGLKDMLVRSGDFDSEKIYVTGTVFRRNVLLQMFTKTSTIPRAKAVLFTSRLDKEKRPEWFLELAKMLGQPGSGISFEVFSGRLVPNEWKEKFKAANVRAIEYTAKKDYLLALMQGAVLLNTSAQDFIGYNQLDAMALGCEPLCPNEGSFPDLFGGDSRYLYSSLEDAKDKLLALLERRTGLRYTDRVPDIYAVYGAKYERSVHRMLDVMFAEPSLQSIIVKQKEAVRCASTQS